MKIALNKPFIDAFYITNKKFIKTTLWLPGCEQSQNWITFIPRIIIREEPFISNLPDVALIHDLLPTN